MRVLHVYRTYFPDTQGGLEEVIRQIARNTHNRGAQVKVYTLSRNPHPCVLSHEDVEVHRVQLSFEVASCGISLTGVAKFELLAEWADVVHYHFPWPYADLLHLFSRSIKPCVVTYHSDIVRQKVLARAYAPLMRRFLRDMDVIACTSPNYLATSEILKAYANVEVIPIGISEASYPVPNEAQVEQVARRYGRDFFLFVGVLRYYKGLHILLDAIKGAPYRVLIVGSGPVESALRAHAAERQVDNVEFTGYVQDATKVALFQLARAVIFPSCLRSEAFGVALLEGAMYGKPMISTELGTGTSHVNVDGETGFVVPPGSAAALRNAMDRLWSSPEAAKRMGQRARDRYEQLFTGELMGRRYMSLYSRVAGKACIEPAATSTGRQ